MKVLVEGHRRSIFWWSLTLGLIVLCRPINVLVLLFLPFLFPNGKAFLEKIKSMLGSFANMLLLVLPFLVIISFQFIYYKLATNHFLVYSYDEEGFNFLNPQWINFLFSYKKGLFLYTPMYLFAAISLFFVKQFSLFQKVMWFISMCLVIYVFSSWWMWFYGGGFSGRVMVEFIPLFMLSLALFLNQLKGTKRIIAINSIVLLIAVCQLQSYQYRFYEIHYSEMTKEKYWDVFLLRNRY